METGGRGYTESTPISTPTLFGGVQSRFPVNAVKSMAYEAK